MAVQKAKPDKSNYLITVIVLLIIAAAAAMLLPVYREYQKAQNELKLIRKAEAQKKSKIADYRRENAELINSPGAVEKAAREEFGLVKPGETVMRYDKPEKNK